MRMRGAHLYLLVEEAHRELRSRVLIGTLAARRGFIVTLISQHEAWYNSDRLEPGLMLAKGYDAIQTRNMGIVRRRGHVTVAIDEESVGLATEDMLALIAHRDIPTSCDVVLAQGDVQRAVLERRFGARAPEIHVTGNPRFDFLRGPLAEPTRADAAALRRRFGDYLLVNTNFSSTNPHDGDSLTNYEICVTAKYIDEDKPQEVADFFDWCRWEHANHAAVLRLLADLRRRDFPWRIIVRPHPSEKLGPWRRAIGDLDGVEVIREGDHLAWTAGARLLVHTNCTTGLEAHLLGTPTFSLTGTSPRWDGKALANEVNIRVTDPATAADAARTIAATGALPPGIGRPDEQRLAKHLHLPTDRTSAELVVDVLARIADRRGLGRGRTRAERVVAFGGQPDERKIDTSVHNAAWISAEAGQYARRLGLAEPPSVVEMAPGIIRMTDASTVSNAA